jgi:tripartite-type tricarboxylate transporter receptor subunit TctC
VKTVRIVALFFAGVTGMAQAQNYPVKPIRMIAPAPGGENDVVARLIAQGLTNAWDEQVVVDNRGSAGGSVAEELLARAPADGYTILFYSSGIWTAPILQSGFRYDVVRDFAPITAAASSPSMVVVHPSSAVGSVRDVIAMAKSAPGKLNYSSGGLGSANHLAAELFKFMASVNIVRIPYNGTGPALSALTSNQVQLMFPAVGSVAPYVKAGRLKALAVTSREPSPLAPGVPTVAASGVPGYESVATSGLFAPLKTPAPVIVRLNRAIVQLLSGGDTKEKLFNSGLEAAGSTPNEFAARIKSEVERLTKVVKAANIRAD